MEVVLELSVGGGAHEQRVPPGEHLVKEPGLGDLGGLDRATEVVVALEHEHALSGLGQQRGAGERVDAAADEDDVVGPAHRPTSSRRKSSAMEQSFSFSAPVTGSCPRAGGLRPPGQKIAGSSASTMPLRIDPVPAR